MRITYFSWLRSEVGFAEQKIDLPCAVNTVQKLIDFLSQTSPGHQRAFQNLAVINVSVNNVMARDLKKHHVSDTDNIAFFSPMAGG